MIQTTCPYALLVAVGNPALQVAILGVYDNEDPELQGSAWDGVIGDGSDRTDLWTVFDDVPTQAGFWVWEGNISWFDGVTAEGHDEGANERLTGTWRRARLREVLEWERQNRTGEGVLAMYEETRVMRGRANAAVLGSEPDEDHHDD